MTTNYYIAFDKFIFRTPLYPFKNVYNINYNDKLFEEALFIASHSLYNDRKKHHTKKVLDSLYKYYSRAATRSTPFGLFASCSIRHTRLDMSYLCSLIQYIESIPDIRHSLLYYPNDSLYLAGDTMRYIEYCDKNYTRIYQVQEIENTSYLTKILYKANYGKTIEDLAYSIINNDITIHEAHTFVENLIKNQILKSELELRLTGDEPLKYLTETLKKKGNGPIADTLYKINELLKDIDDNKCHSNSLYGLLEDLLNTFPIKYEQKYLLQTDAFRNSSSILSESVSKELQDIIDFIIKTNSIVPFKHKCMDDFIKAFENKYEHQEIPLLEALDPDIGIGYPIKPIIDNTNPLIDNITYPMSVKNTYQISYIESVILKKYFNALAKKGNRVVKEITIDEFDFNDFVEINREELYPTCRIMLKIGYDTAKDQYTYYLKSLGGPTASNLLTRFCYMNTDIKDLVLQIYKKERDIISRKGIVAEIIHLPQPRLGNVTHRNVSRDFEIHYLGNTNAPISNVLPASDLVIGLNNNGKLYIRSRTMNCNIIPMLSNAHNYTIDATPAYMFLCDMQYYSFPINFTIFSITHILNILKYVPRIKYKNCYFTMQTWKLSITDIKDKNGKINIELLKRRNIPQKIIIKEQDNELYIDFRKHECQDIFIKMLQKKDLIIEELFYKDDMTIISDGKHGYCGEFILPFYKNENYDKS